MVHEVGLNRSIEPDQLPDHLQFPKRVPTSADKGNRDKMKSLLPNEFPMIGDTRGNCHIKPCSLCGSSKI
jgi:hypothetical protein